jgi:hypothetical protein
MDRIGGQSGQNGLFEVLDPATLMRTERTHPYRGVHLVRHGLIGRPVTVVQR